MGGVGVGVGEKHAAGHAGGIRPPPVLTTGVERTAEEIFVPSPRDTRGEPKQQREGGVVPLMQMQHGGSTQAGVQAQLQHVP